MNTPSCSVPLLAQPLDIAVSASAGLLAAGLVSGAVQLTSFSCPPPAADAEDGGAAGSSQLSYAMSLTIDAPASSCAPSSKKKKAKHGAGEDAGGGEEDDEDEAPSCRAVCFMPGGGGHDWLLAGYSDKAVRAYDVSTGKIVHEYGCEHDQQVSRVYGLECSPGVFASGDEEGLVLLWDSRAAKPIYRYTQHTDYITDMTLHAKDQCLVVTSGDATLSVHDLRKRKARARSEDDNDDELLSCCCVKGGKKVVAGTQSGVLHLYSWGYFNDCSDRFPGHPESVQALVAFDDDTLLTGSSDGAVRVVGVLPNRLLGILGQHNGDHEVERLALSADKRVLASMSHDSAVKLWDLSLLHEEDDEGGEEEEGGEEAAAEEEEAGEGGVQAGAEEQEDGGEGEEDGGEGEEGAGEDGSEIDSSDYSDYVDSSDEDDEGEGEDEDEDDVPDGTGGDDSAGEAAEGGSGKGGRKDAKAAQGKAEAAGKSKGGKAAARRSEKEAGDRAAAVLAAALGGSGGAAAAAAGGKAGSPAPACGTTAADSDSDGDHSSESDGGGKKKKKGKRDRERTKWTKGMEANKKPSGNFFADLL
ncbi:hypothetical protein HYH02_002195 [Chlamydomonas schloesseri]|uniref:Anaphase-promoting complex subunit 4 WD40 domain-containing protein n=1 Tax=Chlamydomonas schloesseri TaxID=2026947 RepID=A0A835WUQ9_9CHLO|nr:hypothetical protein HYH02_002195 [Chlamydomonas schloesseri]|eukprot:KAG2452850.1 hypothetical protein HYH02_002195 [Chlamydomonas schloesseri]